MLTLVIGFKNRPLEHLDRCLASLARQTYTKFSVILVNYGSHTEVSNGLDKVVAKYPFCHVIFTEARGRFWNRSAALNIGIRHVTSEFIVSTDADLIFPPRHLEICARNLAKGKMLYCFPTRLPQNFTDWENVESYHSAQGSETRAFGAFHAVSVEDIRAIRGFDEYFFIWGREDRDLNTRLKSRGIEQVLLNGETAVFHQWHVKVTEDPAHMLGGLFFTRMASYMEKSRDTLTRNSSGWGKILSSADRPSFRYIDPDTGITQLSPDSIWDINPVSNLCFFSVCEAFYRLSSGQALGIRFIENQRSRALSSLTRLSNRFLCRFGIGLTLGSHRQIFRWLLLEFLEANKDAISDYSLATTESTEIAIAVRK